MTDLSLTIAPKSDQLNSDDLIAGPRTITITRVTGNEGSAEQPVNVYFEGDNGKPYRPCKSMRRVMVQVWGKDGTQYPGRSMTLYRDPEVAFGGLKVGGTRISHMSHIEAPVTMALTATRANKKPFTVKPLKVERQADKVAEGVRALLERIHAGEDVAVESAVQKQRAWLAKNRPELAAEIEAAIAAANPDSDNPFSTATADDGSAGEADGQPEAEEVAASASTEGRDDSQMGEQTTLADAKAEIDSCELAMDVNARVSALLPLLSEEDGDELRAYAAERIDGMGAK